MLIYLLRWQPSWISDRHIKKKLGKGHSNDHAFTVWVQSVHYFQRRRSLKFQPIRAYYWPRCNIVTVNTNFNKIEIKVKTKNKTCVGPKAVHV